MSIEELRANMYKGIVQFEYVKMDGSIRLANGTLSERIIPQVFGKRKTNEQVQIYFDVDVNEWRSFRIENLIENNGRAVS